MQVSDTDPDKFWKSINKIESTPYFSLAKLTLNWELENDKFSRWKLEQVEIHVSKLLWLSCLRHQAKTILNNTMG